MYPEAALPLVKELGKETPMFSSFPLGLRPDFAKYAAAYNKTAVSLNLPRPLGRIQKVASQHGTLYNYWVLTF